MASNQAQSPSAQAPSTQAPQSLQAEAASEAQLGLSPSGKLQFSDRGEGDDVSAAIAAASEMIALEPEEGDSQAEADAAEAAAVAEAQQPAEQPAKQQEREAPAKPEAPASKKPAEPRVAASEWARLHKEKRDFFAQQEAAKAERAETARIKAILDNAKSDRLAALEAMGYTDIKEFVEGLAQDGGRMTPERRQLNELQAWKAKQEAAEADRVREQETRQSQQAAHAKLEQLRTQIKDRISSEQYSNRVINLKDADEQVMLEMDRMATETGEMPDIGEAIERVEGRFNTYLEEMAANPAILAFFQDKALAAKSPRAESPQSEQRAKVRTIGGRAPSPSTKPQSTASRSMSYDDQVEAAISAMKASVR